MQGRLKKSNWTMMSYKLQRSPWLVLVPCLSYSADDSVDSPILKYLQNVQKKDICTDWHLCMSVIGCVDQMHFFVRIHASFFKASSHKQAPGWALLSEEANWNYRGSFIRKMCPSGGHPLTEGEANCSLSLCFYLPPSLYLCVEPACI